MVCMLQPGWLWYY